MKKCVFENIELLRKEAESTKKSIESLEKKIKLIEDEGNVVDSVKGGMGGIEHFRIEGFPVAEHERFLMLYRDRKCKLELLYWKIENDVAEIEEIMSQISDPILRVIVNARAIKRLSWEDVAKQVGSNESSEGARKIYERYLATFIEK